MKRTLIFIAALTSLPSSRSAADALDVKVIAARSALENSQAILLDARERERDAEATLTDLFGAGNADTTCQDECRTDFDGFRTKGAIDIKSLPKASSFATAKEKLTDKKPADESAVDSIAKLAEALDKRLVFGTCGNLPGTDTKACVERIRAVAQRSAELEKAQESTKRVVATNSTLLEAYNAAVREQTLASDRPVPRFTDRTERVRRARCATAYCWGGDDGRKMAIEPILDLPIGMFWAANSGALSRYMNANNIKIQFTAGLRYWFAYDAISIGILLAQPNLTETQNTIDFRGKSLATSQVRRPYPTLVMGFWGDILQLSFSCDELRNAPSNSPNHLPEFPANAVLSRAMTFGIAINPLTAARNGIGATSDSKKEDAK